MVEAGQYRSTRHAEQERHADLITMAEFEGAFGQLCDLIEDYADDPRGASCLALSFIDAGRPLHAVMGLADADILIIITLYRPAPSEWINWRVRR